MMENLYWLCDGKFLKKIFELVDHKVLFNILKCYNCNEKCLLWFESYLSYRTERVSLNNTISNPASVTYRVPQDFILGSLLLLLTYMPMVLRSMTSNLTYFN